MLSRIEPEVGCWYEDMDRNVVFEVVCCDEDSVDIQYFEGEIEEIERETFLKMWLQPVQQPEDWSGPFEIDAEELSDTLAPEDNQYRVEGYDSGSMHILDDL